MLIAGSQIELSRRSGVPLRTLVAYLRGENEPKLSAAAAIAHAVAVSLDWLATGVPTPILSVASSEDAGEVERLVTCGALDDALFRRFGLRPRQTDNQQGIQA